METAKLFKNGSSQAVRLPKEYRFEGTEVGIVRLSEFVLLYPVNRAQEIFHSALGNFDGEFLKTLEEVHKADFPADKRTPFK
jgi:antitoxin VapB